MLEITCTWHSATDKDKKAAITHTFPSWAMLPEGKPENKQMSELKWVRWHGGLHTQRGMETGSFVSLRM